MILNKFFSIKSNFKISYSIYHLKLGIHIRDNPNNRENDPNNAKNEASLRYDLRRKSEISHKNEEMKSDSDDESSSSPNNIIIPHHSRKSKKLSNIYIL